MASGVISGKLYAAGGLDSHGNESAVLRVYDPVTNRWTIKASMPTARFGAAGATANGMLFVIGGGVYDTGIFMRNVEAYTP